MARIDKYNPVSGGFRARIGWQPVAAEVGDIIAVTINGQGQAVKAAAATADGVVCLSSLVSSGDVVDVMTHGEIVDVTANDNIAPAAGAEVFAAAAGGFGAAPAAGANGTRIGRFVEAWRLIVRVQRVQG